MTPPRAAGVLLAAGAGTRMGRPKALVRDADGTSWLRRAATALGDGGCDPVVVVLGCEHEAARDLLTGLDVRAVLARDWAQGMGASLRAGLEAVPGTGAPAALVSLVDLPDVGAAVVRRVLTEGWAGAASLARAHYRDGPGHPVLIGSEHWAGVLEVAVGDRGARDHLATHAVTTVDCADLASGEDVDRPHPLP